MIVDQHPLFPVTGAIARHTDPETSHQAAARVGDGAVKAIRAALTLQDWTADELCDYYPTIYGPTLKSALARLHKAGEVKDSGARRISHRGSPMIVWAKT